MKTLLERWLAGSPAFFRSELGSAAALTACEHLPAPTALCFSMRVSGTAEGVFTIAVDRAGLRKLLTAAGVTPDSEDAVRDAELWRGLLEQAARVIVPADDPIVMASPEESTWQLGRAAAAYELRIGEVSMAIAFSDQTRTPAMEAVGDGSHRFTSAGIDLLLDVELEASLRFGSREMSLEEVLELGPGDVVELDRHVSDPVDLLVGDKIVASGEVVLINGSFGLKVLAVAEPRKCLESVRCLF